MSTKRITDFAGLCFCIVATVFLFIYPSYCIDAAKDGLNTALYIVLPSIFPFMVLTKYIINNNLHTKISKFIGIPFETIFNIDKNYAALFVLGCIGGYPIGAISINQMLKKGEISLYDAQLLIGFCNNSSPMFVIGTVGTLMLNNTFYGYILYAIHLLSIVICASVVCRFFNASKHHTQAKKIHFPGNINPVASSANSMINIASYIIIFSVVSKLITVLFKKDNLITILSLCLLEITTGIKHTSLSFLSETIKLSIISAALGFSGFCVLFQSKSVFDGEKISFVKYLISKTLIAALSFVITYLLFSIILP